MDTSEQYIKMAECEEIQEGKPYKDTYYCEIRLGIVYNQNNVIFVDGENNSTFAPICPKAYHIT